MKIAEFPKFCHEVYAVHESFMRFGFKSDDIFVVVNNVIGLGKNILCVELRAQGKKFVVPITPCMDGKDRMFNDWRAFINCVADENTTDEELDASFRSTTMGVSPMGMGILAGTLSKRGFVVPSLVDGGKSMEVFAGEQPGLSKGGDA